MRGVAALGDLQPSPLRERDFEILLILWTQQARSPETMPGPTSSSQPLPNHQRLGSWSWYPHSQVQWPASS